MVSSRVLPPLIALASLMLVVSLALTAVLIARATTDDNPRPAAAGPIANTPLVATATPPPSPTRVPPLPSDIQERLNALPVKLRNETLVAYSRGSLDLDQLDQIVTDYENRNPSVRVGSVVSLSEGRLRLEVFTTGEHLEVATGEDTLVRRGDREIAVQDLLLDELIMVVLADGSAFAVTIEAFGVAAP